MTMTKAVLHTGADLYDDDWQADEDREDVAIIAQGLADLRAGDKGMLLKDYRAEVMAKREARKQQQNAKSAA